MPQMSGTWVEQLAGTALAIFVMGACFFILVRSQRNKTAGEANKGNKKALFQKPTLFQVRELLLRGEKESAIKMYRQIFKIDHKSALKAVEELERNVNRHR